MTTSRRKLGTLFAVTTLLLGAFAVTGIGTALGQATTAGNQGVSLSCVGSGGGAAYVADANLTVYENDTEAGWGTFFFPDEETARFEYPSDALNLSATGVAEARLEDGTGTTTCLGDVNATQHEISIAPDGERGLTVAGEYAGLSFRNPVFDEAADGEADLAYDATDPASMTVTDTGLAEGETVAAVDTADDTELDSATVGADGSMTFDGLQPGTYQVDLRSGTAVRGGESANFSVTDVSTNAPITEGETLTTTITVENTGEASGTQEVSLRDFGDTVVDIRDVALEDGNGTELTLEWETSAGDAGTGAVTVATGNDSATRSVTIEEPGTNDPPTASDDSYTVSGGETLAVSATGVLENDTDPNGDSLSASRDTDVSNGDLTLYANGSFEYTPDDGFTGEDTFTYRVSDGNGGTDTATVTISVTETTTPSATFEVVSAETNAPVTEGETLSVDARVRNIGAAAGTQSVTLQDFDGTEVDDQSITLDAGDETNVTLKWTTGSDGSGVVTVQTANDTATRSVTIDASDDDGSSRDGGSVSGSGSSGDDDESTAGSKSIKRPLSGQSDELELSGGEPVVSVGFESETEIDASVKVRELSQPLAEPPNGTRFVTGADITISAGESSSISRIRIGVDRDRIESMRVEASALSVYHYDDERAEWERLETAVVTDSESEIVVAAEPVGFSPYVVFAEVAPETETVTDPTPTATPASSTPAATSGTPNTAEPQREPTTSGTPTRRTGPIGQPGFGVLLTLSTLLSAAWLFHRR